jgi:hypothetical protein
MISPARRQKSRCANSGCRLTDADDSRAAVEAVRALVNGVWATPDCTTYQRVMSDTDGHWTVRQAAAWAAGQAGCMANAPALEQIARHDNDEQVRYVALLALVRLGHNPALFVSNDERGQRLQSAALAAMPYIR